MADRKKLEDILHNSERERLAQNWTTIKAADDLKPIPAGEYRCRITDGSLFKSAKDTLGYKLTLEVLDGEHVGRRVWLDFWLTEAALPFTKRDLAKLGIDKTEQLERPLPDGIIVTAKVALLRNDDGAEFNRVVRVHLIAVEPPTPDPFAPTDENPPDAKATDADGFDWRNGEQGTGETTP
jgi:hypothetical protein